MVSNALVVATSFLSPDGPSRERTSAPLVDYVQLAATLGVRFTNYNDISFPQPLRHIEDRVRLDIYQALYVAQVVRQTNVGLVVSLSERVAIPLAFFLGRRVKHMVKACHPLSPRKIHVLRLSMARHPWELVNVYTQAEAEAVQRLLGIGSERILVLPDAVDTQFFHPNGEAPSARQRQYFVSVGLSHRDYPLLIRAVRNLPHMTCEIFAGSPWSNHTAGIGQVEIPANVLIRPPTDRIGLRQNYMGSRFVVVPIRATSQWSAGGTAVAEAQSMGKAVIATRTPGMCDYIKDGENGILVQPGDPQSMAEAIDFLWNNPTRAQEMGDRAREWALARYGFDRWLDLMVGAISSLV